MQRVVVLAGLSLLLMAGRAITAERSGKSKEYQLSGEITFNGEVVRGVPIGNASLSIKDMSTKEWTHDAIIDYDYETGRYSARGLTAGRFGILAELHVAGESPRHPGNYRAWKEFNPAALTKDEAAAFRVPASRIIRLIKPFDNSGFQTTNIFPVISSPVSFSWEAIDGAVRYEMTIDRYSLDSRLSRKSIVATSITEHSIEVELPLSEERTAYEFRLYAYSAEDEQLGYYMTNYRNPEGFGLGYAFRIEDPEL